MQERELLKRLGEETLYSAKGHFKACDVRRKLFTFTIWLCALINVIGIVGIHPLLDKWLFATGLFGSIALLIWNQGEGKFYRARHKEAGETYLSIHKEIRKHYFMDELKKDDIDLLNQKVIDFDKSDKPEIPGFARMLAKRAIEKKGETDNWFLEEKNEAK